MRVQSLTGASARHRGRGLGKTMHNLKVTLLCGLLTFIVLRSSLGAGRFGTPAQDYSELREHLHLARPHKLGLHQAAAVVQEEAAAAANARRSTLSIPQARDDDPDPEPALQGPYSLGVRISDWDEQRRAWLARHPEYRTSGSRPRILLVTGSQPSPCENPVGDHYLVKSIKNKIDYCRLHNIEIFYNMAHLDPVMSGFWAKLPLLRKLMLSHPEIEWIWWMDSDAMFTDMVFELPIDKYKDYNAVFHGWDELVYNKKTWIGLNTGSFLIRNCQWSLDLMDAWAPMGPKGKVREEAGKVLTRSLEGRPEFEADDQSALIYLLITQRAKWGDKVFLESAYYLHGYWVILVDKYEEMIEKYHPGLGDDRWPFVTHFVGCKPCGKGTDYAAQRCLKQMERAFNFADNQVLQMYGFQHKNLASYKVKRIRNDMSRPLDFQDELKLLHRRNPASPSDLI